MLIKKMILIILSLMNFSCTEKNRDVVPETFDMANRPYFKFDSGKNQYLLEPWNYNLQQNEDRKYPLVIFLHGSGGAGDISYLNYLGYDKAGKMLADETALKFQKEHPCFVLVPQTGSEWNNNNLIGQVEFIKTSYRIDTSRIYLIGYSMGGSGSYSFANSYFDFNRHLFAGIIRLAGQSQTVVSAEIANRTAIWLHIGLKDLEERINVTRDAYAFLKSSHPEAVETTEAVDIPGINGITYNLKISEDDMFKRTEYENTGHDIVLMPFKDEYLIEWLFRHKLKEH
jgi:predicted peptidase